MFSAFFRSLKQEFAGYNSKKLLADMMAGLTVCAVALPLALAFGVSSGASAASGLVTAIIAGVVIAVLGGASFQISGPTGAMSAVLVGIVAEYGLQGVFFACFAAGVLLLLSGIFKLGRLISFIPMPVIMGFTSGIAIIIAMGQIDNFFGTVSEGGTNLEKLASYGRLGFHPNMQAVLIGLLVVLVMVFWPKKWGARVPGSLVGIILATIVATVAGMDQLAVVGDIPKTLLLADRLSLGGLSFTMLENLLSNAVKYGRDGGHIEVTLKNKDGVTLSVKDDGIGIKDEDLPKIWGRFYRADESRSRESGFGLGLSLVSQIATLHGGKADVTSVYGEGSEFTVTFREQ